MPEIRKITGGVSASEAESGRLISGWQPMPEESRNRARSGGMPLPDWRNPGTASLPQTQAEPELPEEAYCSITNRIVIVSPFPGRIHELIRGLSAVCYDVMVFHHGDPGLVNRLQADLLIADCTRTDDEGSRDWLQSPELAGVRVLRLIPPGTADSTDSAQLEWPVPLTDAITFIRNASEEGVGTPRTGSDYSSDYDSGTGSRTVSPAGTEQPSEGILQLKDLTLDLKRYAASIGTTRLDLTRTEFDLLRSLLEAGGSVLTRQELMDRVWGDDYFGGSNTVDVHVKTLRQKLGDNPKHARYIATVRGIGYRATDE